MYIYFAVSSDRLWVWVAMVVCGSRPATATVAIDVLWHDNSGLGFGLDLRYDCLWFLDLGFHVLGLVCPWSHDVSWVLPLPRCQPEVATDTSAPLDKFVCCHLLVCLRFDHRYVSACALSKGTSNSVARPSHRSPRCRPQVDDNFRNAFGPSLRQHFVVR